MTQWYQTTITLLLHCSEQNAKKYHNELYCYGFWIRFDTKGRETADDHSNQIIKQSWLFASFVGQRPTTCCTDGGTLQPTALSADDVRVAVWVLSRPVRLLRCRRLVQLLPQQCSKEPPGSTHRHRSVLRIPLFARPARYQWQVRHHRKPFYYLCVVQHEVLFLKYIFFILFKIGCCQL